MGDVAGARGWPRETGYEEFRLAGRREVVEKDVGKQTFAIVYFSGNYILP